MILAACRAIEFSWVTSRIVWPSALSSSKIAMISPPVRSAIIGFAEHEGENTLATVAVKRRKRRLPERLAQVRGDRSQRRFARDLGVFHGTVNRYENGTTPPHADFLTTLALKQGIPIDWLLLGEGNMRRIR